MYAWRRDAVLNRCSHIDPLDREQKLHRVGMAIVAGYEKRGRLIIRRDIHLAPCGRERKIRRISTAFYGGRQRRFSFLIIRHGVYLNALDREQKLHDVSAATPERRQIKRLLNEYPARPTK